MVESLREDARRVIYNLNYLDDDTIRLLQQQVMYEVWKRMKENNEAN